MEILYQDDSIIAVNKPSGLLTIRDGYNPDLPTVKSEIEKDYGRCWIVHRLDKETSGVLLLARNEKAHKILNLAFENHQIRKTYHAIICGIPSEQKFTISSPLKVDGDRKHRTVVDLLNGKPAKSAIMVLESYNEYSLVEIKPESGYTHQIRAHLSFAGFPILGDKLYLKPGLPQTDLIFRTALHAFQITFDHPVTRSTTTIQAVYPQDFSTALATLK
ncbi:RluA family pseudouridine synthase [bacterium]|nr:RluA family pseudouridine synthase [bacterium]